MKSINLGQKEIIHFIGIGGIGMSGLAQIMNNMGFQVQGSDLNSNNLRLIYFDKINTPHFNLIYIYSIIA